TVARAAVGGVAWEAPWRPRHARADPRGAAAAARAATRRRRRPPHSRAPPRSARRHAARLPPLRRPGVGGVLVLAPRRHRRRRRGRAEQHGDAAYVARPTPAVSAALTRTWHLRTSSGHRWPP